MNKKHKAAKPARQRAQNMPFDSISTVASSTECTGLLPTPATDEEELESYTHIYDVPLTDSPNHQFEDDTHYPDLP